MEAAAPSNEARTLFLRSFAEHLQKYILVPSGRYSSAGHNRNRSGLAGFFTYDRPSHLPWNQ